MLYTMIGIFHFAYLKPLPSPSCRCHVILEERMSRGRDRTFRLQPTPAPPSDLEMIEFDFDVHDLQHRKRAHVPLVDRDHARVANPIRELVVS